MLISIYLVIVILLININDNYSYFNKYIINKELYNNNIKKSIILYEKTNKNDFNFKQNNQLKIDPIRFISFNILAVVIAFGSNFVGITSNLLSTNPQLYRNLGFDQIYSINGYKKYIDSNNNYYTFRYPYNWLIDQSIVLADIKERETPSIIRNKRPRGIRPEVAFGPPGIANNRENLSVVKSIVLPGFSLQKTLGEPKEAALKLLENYIATPSSGKTYQLLNAFADNRNGRQAYHFEYIVSKGEEFNQHSVSVIINKDNDLYTLTAVAPEVNWDSEKEKIYEIANSFEIL